MTEPTHDICAADCLDTASTWLSRVGVEHPDGCVIVNVAPVVGIGAWRPGPDQDVKPFDIGKAEAEVLAALAPIVEQIVLAQPAEVQLTVLCPPAGTRLQAILAPGAGWIGVRLVNDVGAVDLGAVQMRPERVN